MRQKIEQKIRTSNFSFFFCFVGVQRFKDFEQNRSQIQDSERQTFCQKPIPPPRCLDKKRITRSFELSNQEFGVPPPPPSPPPKKKHRSIKLNGVFFFEEFFLSLTPIENFGIS